MRRILAILAALLLCTSPASADVSVGNGSVGVPIAATQGGTGQTSFVTNCIVAATSSSALGCTGTPAITTGATFTANPGGLTAGTLNDYEIGTWTPTDASGASLALTINGATYVKIGRIVQVTADVTYPTTVSAASAAITLPFSVNATINQALAVGYNTSATAFDAVASSGSTITFYALGGLTTRTNVQLSTFRVLVSGTYQSAA